MVGILLAPVLLLAALLVANIPSIIHSIVGPSEDPALICQAPDPSPLAEASGASLVLQACAAGKTFAIKRGEAFAVDLTGVAGVDTSDTWHELTVSDSAILGTIAPPATIFVDTRYGERGRWFDYVAVYEGVHRGEATVTALLNRCGIRGCWDTNRWRVTVQVT